MVLAAGTLTGRRVLVTGANGLIGTDTVTTLLEAGAVVTALSLTEDRGSRADRVLVGDVTDEQVVADALDEVDAVVHLAAMPHRDAGPAREVYRVNVVSTWNVLSLAGERGIGRVVAASSINAYGLIQNLTTGLRPPSWPLDADTPSDLGDWYSLSKKNGEDAAHAAWRAWGVDVISLRFPMTQPHHSLTEIADRRDGDPGERMLEGWSYLDTRDAGRAIAAGLVSPTTGAHAMFVAAPQTLMPYRTQDLLDRYSLDVPCRRRFTGREVPIDLQRARDLIGFEAVHTIDLPTLDLPDA